MARVSIRDVAKKAGVSVATVSLVLNGKGKELRVSEALAEKVRNEAKSLNYKPNSFARGLRNGRSETIGLIVADISNPFFAHLAFHIQCYVEEYGYSVIIANSDEKTDKMEKIISVLKSRQVDGFIIVPTEHGEKQIESLVKDKYPVVLVDRFFKGIEVSQVFVDNYKASMEATNLLLNLNCKRIAHINYVYDLPHTRDRKEGYVTAMTKKGLYDPKLIKEVNFWTMVDDVQHAIMELISGDEKIDGFFFASNTITITSLKILSALKLDIQKDIKMVCFDRSEVFDLFNYSIPYIRQPIPEMGKRAVELLFDQINSKDASFVYEELQANLVW